MAESGPSTDDDAERTRPDPATTDSATVEPAATETTGTAGTIGDAAADAGGPSLIVVCGLPGAGKTTVSRQVADRVDGRLLRTDVVRKDLFPDPEYTSEESRRTYEELFERARSTVADDRSVVLDGTFREQSDRERAARVARECDASFQLVRVECAEDVVEDRIAARTDDASDADFSVYRLVRDSFESIDRDHVRIDNSDELDDTKQQVLSQF